MQIQNLNKKQMKIVNNMDSYIYLYRANMKKDPEQIVLFREDYIALDKPEEYKGIKVGST